MRTPLEVMPNLMPEINTWQSHILNLDPACPVSGNPRLGSKLEIRYQPKLWHLEVYSLRSFVNSYKGGLRNSKGAWIVRDQEHMIQYVAQSCANAVQVKVTVISHLILSDGVSMSEMRLTCKAFPQTKKSASVSRFSKAVGNAVF